METITKKPNFFLNVDVRANSNCVKDEYQVIHVETSTPKTPSIYAIAAIFKSKKETNAEKNSKNFEEISINKLALRNIVGPKKKIINAVVASPKNGFVYELLITLGDDTGNDLINEYTPNNQHPIIFKKFKTDDVLDVTIVGPPPVLVGHKICKFRIT